MGSDRLDKRPLRLTNPDANRDAFSHAIDAYADTNAGNADAISYADADTYPHTDAYSDT
jgi:hypothetical protein